MNCGNMVMSEIEVRLGKDATNADIAALLQVADEFAERNTNGTFSVEATGLFHCERGMPVPERDQGHASRLW
ncbi:hypothetical protein PENTCL1PPCAC_13392, partial [Pristionchus entomophagus]